MMGWPDLLTFFGLALALDLIAGGRRLLGWVPGPNEFFDRLATFFSAKLDRKSRSNSARRFRGIFVCLLILPLLFFFGQFLNRFIYDTTLITIVLAIGLALMLRQRRLWDDIIDTLKAGTAPQNARKQIDAVIMGFSDGVVVSLTLFLLGGFALLLPYRFVRVSLEQQQRGTGMRPDSPFLALFWSLGELAAFIGSWIAAAWMAMAHIFLPGTSLSAFYPLITYKKGVPLSRQFTLGVIGYGSGLSFEDGRTKSGGWIGPQDGRARQTAADIRRVGLVLVVAALVGLTCAIMTLAFAITAA